MLMLIYMLIYALFHKHFWLQAVSSDLIGSEWVNNSRHAIFTEPRDPLWTEQ